MNNETKKSPFCSTFDQVEFGKRIRKVRKSQGLSQKELAQMTDENREGSYISNFETGQNATTLDGAVEIANALGVSLDYLCNRDDFVNRPITMGDVARSLMILPFLNGMNFQWKHTNMDNLDSEGNFGSTKQVPTFEIRSGSLRKFFCQYQAHITRSDPKDFLDWLRGQMERLDNTPIWNEKNDSRWNKCAERQSKRHFPEDKLKSLLWNHGADYSMELNDLDTEFLGENDIDG